jgi:hypothetical protein
MCLMWTVPITHLRHAFIQCCASFPLLRWEYLYAMAAAIKNMDSAVTNINNIQDTIQVFQIWHNLCSELTSMWTFKMYSRNTKTTSEPTASNNKSDRPQVKIWDTWKTVHILVSSEHKLCQIWKTCIVSCILLIFFLQSLLSRVKYTNYSV